MKADAQFDKPTGFFYSIKVPCFPGCVVLAENSCIGNSRMNSGVASLTQTSGALQQGIQ